MKLERLEPSRSVLLVIDIQEKLAPAMRSEIAAAVIKQTLTLVAASARLGIPVVASEQYPQGLGATVPELAAALRDAKATMFSKVEFSAVQAPAFADIYPTLGARDQWICAGMEAHICVWQTVRDLRARGLQTHVASDAVASRRKANWRTGLELARSAGAVVSGTETILFDWLGRAGTPEFKELSRLIR